MSRLVNCISISMIIAIQIDAVDEEVKQGSKLIYYVVLETKIDRYKYEKSSSSNNCSFGAPQIKF